MTLSDLRDDLIQKIDQDLIANPKNVRDWVDYLADLVQILGGAGDVTAAEIKDAIETANFAKNMGVVGASTLRTVESNTGYPIVATPHSSLLRNTLTASGMVDLAAVDVNSFSHSGQLALVTRIVNSATPPGANRSVQIQWAFENVPGLTNPVQFTTFDSRVFPIVNLANVVARNPPMERIQVLGRYLYVWLVWPALDTGSTLTLTNELVAV
jgi:hypothetical protein